MILIQLLYSNTSHFGPPYLEHYKLNYIHCYQVTNIFVNIKIKQKWITVKPGQAYPQRIHFFHFWIYYSKVESIDSCRFQIDVCILVCVMSREFTCEAVMKFLPAPFSWNWCKCLLRSLIHSKISNLTKYREVLVKYSLLITHAEMPLWIWHQLRERLTDSFFK